MTKNPNELTIENSALVLIDHQPGVALRAALANVTAQHGGSAALLVDYVMAQVAAGVVSLRDFLSAPLPAEVS